MRFAARRPLACHKSTSTCRCVVIHVWKFEYKPAWQRSKQMHAQETSIVWCISTVVFYIDCENICQKLTGFGLLLILMPKIYDNCFFQVYANNCRKLQLWIVTYVLCPKSTVSCQSLWEHLPDTSILCYCLYSWPNFTTSYQILWELLTETLKYGLLFVLRSKTCPFFQRLWEHFNYGLLLIFMPKVYGFVLFSYV